MWFEMQVLHSNRASKQGTTRPAANVCHHSQAKLHSPYLGAALACSLECTSIVIICLPRGTRCRSSTNVKTKKKRMPQNFGIFHCVGVWKNVLHFRWIYTEHHRKLGWKGTKKKVDGLMKDFVAELLRKQEGGGDQKQAKTSVMEVDAKPTQYELSV